MYNPEYIIKLIKDLWNTISLTHKELYYNTKYIIYAMEDKKEVFNNLLKQLPLALDFKQHLLFVSVFLIRLTISSQIIV